MKYSSCIQEVFLYIKQKILNEFNLGEDHERECKLATGGLLESIWETYSSFANTNGGAILLGMKEHRDSFTVEGLTDMGKKIA